MVQCVRLGQRGGLEGESFMQSTYIDPISGVRGVGRQVREREEEREEARRERKGGGGRGWR